MNRQLLRFDEETGEGKKHIILTLVKNKLYRGEQKRRFYAAIKLKCKKVICKKI